MGFPSSTYLLGNQEEKDTTKKQQATIEKLHAKTKKRVKNTQELENNTYKGSDTQCIQ